VAKTCTENGHKQTITQALQYKKVATTCTEDGHKQTTKSSTTIQTNVDPSYTEDGH